MRKRELPNKGRARPKLKERKRDLPHVGGDRDARSRVTNPSIKGSHKYDTVSEHMMKVLGKEDVRVEKENKRVAEKQREQMRKVFDG